MPEGITISPQPSEVGSISVGNVVRKFAGKTTAPTVNDDIDQGYIVSDLWIDEVADKVYQCVDNTNGASVWPEISSGSARHTTNAGETLTIADYEQHLVSDVFTINGSGTVTVNDSGELVVIGV